MDNINFDAVKPVFDNINNDDCMFVYPIYVKDRDSLKNYLAQNKVFTAVYWNIKNIPQLSNNAASIKRSERILALPINHNYDSNDMILMAELINKWQKTKC